MNWEVALMSGDRDARPVPPANAPSTTRDSALPRTIARRRSGTVNLGNAGERARTTAGS